MLRNNQRDFYRIQSYTHVKGSNFRWHAVEKLHGPGLPSAIANEDLYVVPVARQLMVKTDKFDNVWVQDHGEKISWEAYKCPSNQKNLSQQNQQLQQQM
ncbi:unnamed protein product [Caretta caretta]